MDSRSTLLGELASLVGGQLIGDANAVCRGAAPLYEVSAGEVTFLDSSRGVESVVEAGAVAVVVNQPLPDVEIHQIVVEHPHDAFATIVSHFQPAAPPAAAAIHPSATIDPTAVLGCDVAIEANVTIGRGVVIGDRCRLMPGVVVMDQVRIGDDCVLYPGVTLYDRTVLEERVTVHAGSVLGAFGFGYKTREGRHHRAPQLGYVHIEADVEIGASVTIDRGTFGSTRIGTGTKIDNQVMIAHNCQIGRHNLICSQVGIAGSCRTGDHVILAGQVGLKDHITLGEGAIVGAQAGVMEDLAGGQVYLGSPATTQREQMQIMAIQRRLPEMRRAIKTLERAVETPVADSRTREQTDGAGSSRCVA
ncbi:UDP-3-O-(3-hydroxymyristoyl)glucosamine N-acyltransferase [Candidatus Laterigemmans baculatus]|uniref:UDP-3-O-(3-hydroxymyristoyl)glucosamine N-acyltransferase n=1 Tax=Candidatus Laterigemmans baculatus TaxID=2770505 RepID=UPI001F34561B|nr:UDP-3-O-(3-hydroxymyristoyl)glucosamine N-acyltransferase [Candidatus Laterigemmans baculatus]